MISHPSIRSRALRLGVILVTLLLGSGALRELQPNPAMAASGSSQVAYVYDASNAGVNGSSSLFANALCGTDASTYCPAYTAGTGNSATYNGVTLTNVPVSTVDTNGASAFSGYDTVLLYEVCDIGSPQHAATMSAVNSFLANGGKVLIFDADRCNGTTAPDYSTFTYPFTTSNPGPMGSGGSYSFIEQNSLTTGLSTGNQAGDSVGDANAFVTYNGAWCGSITGINYTGKPGFVQAYARGPNGTGLVVYEGEDFYATGNGNTGNEEQHLNLLFSNLLSQPFSPDRLPCSLRASGISLGPPSASQPVGGSQTETATIADVNGYPQNGITVTFTVKSGPNAGKTGTGTTNSSGQATFPLSSSTAGTDVIVATYTDSNGATHTSNQASVQWANPTITRVASFTVSHRGARITVRWRMADTTGIAGFNLYAGTQRFNRYLIRVHADRAYHFRGVEAAHVRISLRLVLADGQEIPSSR